MPDDQKQHVEHAWVVFLVEFLCYFQKLLILKFLELYCLNRLGEEFFEFALLGITDVMPP